MGQWDKNTARNVAATAKMAELMGGQTYNGQPAALPFIRPAPALPKIVIPQLAEGAIHLGDAGDTGGPIGFDMEKLLDGRLLVQGASGSGKSWTLRRILERTQGQIQQIIVDPEGEFRNFADAYGHILIEAHRLDIAAIGKLARRIREHRISVLFDLSDMDRTEQMMAVSSFLDGLIQAPREHWHPTLVCIDEAHLFAPHGLQGSEPTSVRKESVAAVADLMSRGRKRGLCGVLATQCLARLSKSVVSEVFNFAVGLNTLDLDIRRAAETIGWDARKAFDRLPSLGPDEFVVSGPAFSRSPVTIKVGAVDTAHRGARPAMTVPQGMDQATAHQALDLEALMADTAEDEEIRGDDTLLPGAREVRTFIRDEAFVDVGAVWGAIVPLMPEGARLTDIADHLETTRSRVAAACFLLDRYSAVEFTGDGDDRAVRVVRAFFS